MLSVNKCGSLEIFCYRLLVPYYSHCTSCISTKHFSSASNRNLYDVLGVDKSATTKEIKQAFYAKSKLIHPDNSNEDSSAAFVELKAAYDILRRPADRKAYDNRGKRSYQNVYNPHGYQSSHPPFYAESEDWKQFWRQNRSDNVRDSHHKKRADDYWRSMMKWTALGVVIVIFYNVGYVGQLKYRERQIAALVDEHEIAKSFLRQPEFKDKEVDSVEFDALSRMLKADMDEAWRRRSEDLTKRNKDEIREEYRWFRVLHDREKNRDKIIKRGEAVRKGREDRLAGIE